MKVFPVLKQLFILGLMAFSLMFTEGVLASRDVVETSVVAKSDKQSQSSARQEIFKSAVESVSLDYIRQIIGQQKLEKNRELIENKVLRNSGKYVLYIKGEALSASDNGIEMTVKMKLSLKSLQKLLLDEGLLYKIDGPPKVLGMVTIQDRVNAKSYSWWADQLGADGGGFLRKEMESFHSSLRKDLMPRGFYALAPVRGGFGDSIPMVFRSENLPTEDFLFVGGYFQSQIVIRGLFRIDESQKRSGAFNIDLKLTALHTSNGRVVGEVIRSYETDPGPFRRVVSRKFEEISGKVSKDLTIQLHDAWRSGTFGASLIQLTVSGDLDYQHLAQLKKLFLEKISDLKTLRERKFSPGQVTFEVDASAGARELANAFRSNEFPRFKVEVAEVRPEGVELKVKAQ